MKKSNLIIIISSAVITMAGIIVGVIFLGKGGKIDYLNAYRLANGLKERYTSDDCNDSFAPLGYKDTNNNLQLNYYACVIRQNQKSNMKLFLEEIDKEPAFKKDTEASKLLSEIEEMINALPEKNEEIIKLSEAAMASNISSNYYDRAIHDGESEYYDDMNYLIRLVNAPLKALAPEYYDDEFYSDFQSKYEVVAETIEPYQTMYHKALSDYELDSPEFKAVENSKEAKAYEEAKSDLRGLKSNKSFVKGYDDRGMFEQEELRGKASEGWSTIGDLYKKITALADYMKEKYTEQYNKEQHPKEATCVEIDGMKVCDDGSYKLN